MNHKVMKKILDTKSDQVGDQVSDQVAQLFYGWGQKKLDTHINPCYNRAH